jgi:hypothetical protein
VRKSAPTTIADEVERYIRTGETDPHHAAWPGNGFMERANHAHDDLRGALVREVRRLAEGLAHEPIRQADTVALCPRAAWMMLGRAASAMAIVTWAWMRHGR